MVLGLVVSSVPAYAGFQWVAPSDGTTYQVPANGTYAAPPPIATTSPEVISPVIITGDSRSSQPAYQPPAPVYQPSPAYQAPQPTYQPPVVQPSASVEVTPPAKTDLATATISIAPPPPPAPSMDQVQGFAAQIPLALALRQVLPAGYNFSLDQDVDMNTLVSYKGGKSWRDTVRDMLAPVGLVDHEQGTAITVSRAAVEPAAAPVAMNSASVPPLPAPKPINQLGTYTMPISHSDVPDYNVGQADGWSAERGDTLRKVLTDWCRRGNVELQWIAEYDYPVEASAHFNGSFEDAVRSLLAGFDGARPQPVGELHTNSNAGQMVLVVQARGNSYSN